MESRQDPSLSEAKVQKITASLQKELDAYQEKEGKWWGKVVRFGYRKAQRLCSYILQRLVQDQDFLPDVSTLGKYLYRSHSWRFAKPGVFIKGFYSEDEILLKPTGIEELSKAARTRALTINNASKKKVGKKPVLPAKRPKIAKEEDRDPYKQMKKEQKKKAKAKKESTAARKAKDQIHELRMILPDVINLELRKLSDDALVKIKDKLKAKIAKLKPDSAENLIYGPICLEIESLLTTKKPFEEITFTPYAKPAEDELVKIVSKITTTPLTSEDVTTLINFVSAHSSTNYSSKILQGKQSFNDLEASNLLLVEDKYGNTISDYLISCINKYSTADKFTTTSALLAALSNGVDGARRSTPEYLAHSRAPQPPSLFSIYRSLDPKAIRSTLSSHRPYSHPLYNLSSTLVPFQQGYVSPAHNPPVYYPADPAQQKEALDGVFAKVKLLEKSSYFGKALKTVLKYHIDYSNELGMARVSQVVNAAEEYERLPQFIAWNVLRPFRLRSTFKTLLNSVLKLKTHAS